MRNFFGSIIGVLAGITTILVTFMMAATYLAMPTVAVANPTYQWVLQFLISNGTLVVVAYAALNVWSASVDHGSTWANSLDKALSVIALVVLTMIAVLVIGQAIIQTPTAEKLAEMYNAYPLLLAAWLFSIFDVFVAQNRTRGVSVHAEASGTGAATGEVVNIVRERVIRTVETRYEQPTYAPATGDRPPRTAEPTAPTAVAS
jgi:hypothetical protein